MSIRTGFMMSVVLVLVVAVIGGCASRGVDSGGASPSEPAAPTIVTDLAGRTVEVPESVRSVIALGSGSLRLVCYVDGADRVVGIEEFETRPPVQRPYTLAYPELLDLPIIGPGGPDSVPDTERILDANPDVIFISQMVDADAAEKLQATVGIPVFVLSYGDLGSFDEALFTSLELVGEVMGKQDRAAEVATYIRDAIDDLGQRSKALSEAQRPSAYVGALGHKGAHGIESTQGQYPPFEMIGANSLSGSLGKKGSIMIDKEQLLQWDPDFIFLDRSGLGLVLEDVAANPKLYEALSAVRGGNVHTQIPFNNYWTNIETALANSYYAGEVLFPEQFADVDAGEKLDELSEKLLGAPMYDKLVDVYGGGFGPIDLFAPRK